MIRGLVLDNTLSSRCLQGSLSLIFFLKIKFLINFFKAYWPEDRWLHLFRGLWRAACLKCMDAVPAGREVGTGGV